MLARCARCPDLEDKLEAIVDEARRLGASYSEARIQRNIVVSISSRNGIPIKVDERIDEGLAIRVLVDGALGFSSTNSMDDESISKCIDYALSTARASSKYMRRPICFSKARLGSVRYEVKEKESFDAHDISDKFSLHKSIYSMLRDTVKNVELEIFSAEYMEMIEEKLIVNSDGGFVSSRIPRLSLRYNIILRDPIKGSIQRINEYGFSGGLEKFREQHIDENIIEESRRLEKVLLESVKPPSGIVDVVVGSEVASLIVHESCGHPCEADRILGREAAQAGLSFIKPSMKGARIGSIHATVVDDPTIPGSFGFYLYDDECVAAGEKYLYREGVIEGFLHNRWTAYVFGVESNGSARALNYRSEPIVRMSNTYLTPGDYSLEELIEGIRDGVYISSYMEWNIDDERWNQRYVGLEAYRIIGGELREPVRNPILEITTSDFYSKIDAKGCDLRFEAGLCGKGEPMQGIPVWFGSPDVRLRHVKLGVHTL
ncbi:TldD/PmbA family protein [Candidatus Bathyarchaeota archaeon]|nr:TldD/PmbA family protein [Candidatus Bathyarchaeota archaeon]